MIENGKVKALSSELRSVSAMVNGYRDTFKALPGDDPAAVAHQAGTTQATAGTAGNGRLDTGTWVGAAIPAAGDESSLFWQHVRRAGLATGASEVGTAENAVGGKLGVTSNSNRPKSPDFISGSYYVCSSGLTGKLARAIDLQLDDGLGKTGQVFGSVEGSGPVTNVNTALDDYADESFYTICLAQ
jgi:hypothetical protein